MKNYFVKKCESAFFIYLICSLFCLVDYTHAEEFIRVKTVIGVNSNISAGSCPVEQLVKYARKSGVGVLILTDQALARGEFGIWPFRHLIRKTVEKDSILKFGAQKYLDLINRINKEHPEVLIIPACEAAPFYWWEGSFFKGNLTAYDWSKQLIVIGLDNAKDYQNLPLLSNKYKGLKYGFRSLLRLWPILGLFLGLFIFNICRIKYIDELGRDLSCPNFLARRTGIVVIIISLMFLVNNFPFTVPFEFDPYHGNQGILPYQHLIDYANLHNALSFWMSVESEARDKVYGINFITPAHKEDLFISSGYTGFSAIYGDSRTVHKPKAQWDRLLNDYCLGKRTKPLWGIGETGFKGGDKIDYIHNVLFLKEFNFKGVIDALREGRFYSIGGSKNESNLMDFSIKDAQTGQIAYMGEELSAKDVVCINVEGYQPAGSKDMVVVKLIKNGEVFRTFETREEKFEYQIWDEVPKERMKNFYRLIIEGPSEIISNPIFVKSE